MRPLSPTEAISPAIERAKSLLRPFSLGLWIKLGLVGLLAEMSSQVPFPPLGGAGAGAHNPAHNGTTTIRKISVNAVNTSVSAISLGVR